MAKFQITGICLAVIMTVQGQAPSMLGSRPRPGGPSLGAVMPQLSGWGPGWNVPTTAPPTLPPTTGWPATEVPTTGWPAPAPGWPATTAAPTAPPTVGWPSTLPPPTGWPSTLPPTTGWPATAPPQTGWPAPAPGWPAPAPGWSAGPIDIEMLGESAVLGAGEAGATHGSQTIVTGDASNPAIATIQTGSSSSLGQGSGILQISNIASTGESNTLQAIDGYNTADGVEYFAAGASGNNINTVSSGASFVVGEGVIGEGGITTNTNPGVPHPGWGGK